MDSYPSRISKNKTEYSEDGETEIIYTTYNKEWLSIISKYIITKIMDTIYN